MTLTTPPEPRTVLVCQHVCCLENGSEGVLAAFQAAELPPGVAIEGVPCLGQCSVGPTVRVLPDGTWYCRIQVADVPRIIHEHLEGNEPVVEKLHPRFHGAYNPF